MREAAAPAGGLSRATIVEAAVALADEEGLEAVSIRRVAAALKARPMSLYPHIGSKDDLIDLMIDAVVRESLLPEPIPSGWREALVAIADHSRAACLRHPWIAAAHSRRSSLGPHSLRHFEQSLAAVASLDVSDERRVAILTATDTYTMGHVTFELVERETLRRNRLTASAWQEAKHAYVTRTAAEGGFPHLAALTATDAAFAPTDHDARFAEGLNWLLDGIAAQLAA